MLIKVKPTERQIIGARFLLARKAGILSYQTGSGKSLIQVLCAFRSIKDQVADKCITVGTVSSLIEIDEDYRKFTDLLPVVVKTVGDLERFLQSSNPVAVSQYNWFERMVFTEDSPEDQKKVEYLESQATKRLLTMAETTEILKLKEKRSEEVRRKAGRVYQLLKTKKVMFTFDEGHMLKNPEASATKVFGYLRSAMTRAYILTGTALMKDVYDLYHVIRFLDPNVLGSLDSFNDRFVEREIKRIGRRRKAWVVRGFKNLEGLKFQLDSILQSHHPPKDIRYSIIEGILDDRESYLQAAKGVFNTTDKKQHSARLIDLQMVVNRSKAKLRAFFWRSKRKNGQWLFSVCLLL